MIEFWSVVAIAWLLLLLVLLRPLLRRPASGALGLMSRKSRSLISVLVATFVVASSALLYVYWSNGYSSLVASSEQQSDMIELTEQLAARLAQSPQDNPDGWLLLASSYAALQQYDKAVGAYAQAELYTTLETWAQIGYAEALLITEGAPNTKAMALLEAVLASDPDDQRGLFLIGIAYMEQANYAQTVSYWQHLLTLLSADDPLARAVEERLVEVKALATKTVDDNESPQAIPTEQTEQPPPVVPKPPDANCFIRIEVRLASELSANVSASDTLFVYAKAAQGPPMPLAIKQFQAGALPLETCLGPDDAMIQGMTVEQFSPLIVIARVSKLTTAMPQPGDLQASSEPIVAEAGTAVSLTIDEVLE
ncbi:MAG: hypothetical protein GDA45_00540 [Chromatiales bacterium]|nr:hypothetical protein [Chromatiales bacterium]